MKCIAQGVFFLGLWNSGRCFHWCKYQVHDTQTLDPGARHGKLLLAKSELKSAKGPFMLFDHFRLLQLGV